MVLGLKGHLDSIRYVFVCDVVSRDILASLLEVQYVFIHLAPAISEE